MARGSIATVLYKAGGNAKVAKVLAFASFDYKYKISYDPVNVWYFHLAGIVITSQLHLAVNLI